MKIQIQGTDAHIIIDMQIGFVPGGGLPVAGGMNILPVINRVNKLFDRAFMSQDWHPANHGSFCTQHNVAPFTMVELDGLPQVAWPPHCVQGTLDAEFVAGLDDENVAAIIRKGMDPLVDSYSAFYDNARRNTTGLTALLKALGFKRLFFTGLARNYCVAFSALDAVEDGFEAYIIEDGTMPIFDGTNDAMTERLKAAGVNLITSADLL